MARPFPPGATTQTIQRTAPLLPMPAEDNNAAWPLLKLTPAQLATVKNSHNGWLLTDSLGAQRTADVVQITAAPGQVAGPSAAPRVAGPQVAQGQAAAPTPTTALGQTARQAAADAFNQPTGQAQRPVGAAAQARKQAAGAQAIRVSGPMASGAAAPAGGGKRPPGGLVVPPIMQAQRTRPLARWALSLGVLACLAAIAPLESHLLVIASGVVGLIALTLGIRALRLMGKSASERRLAGLGLTLGVIGLMGAIALTIVSIEVLHR